MVSERREDVELLTRILDVKATARFRSAVKVTTGKMTRRFSPWRTSIGRGGLLRFPID